MPRGGLPEKVLPQTLYREYWEKPVSHWSLEGWEEFFSKRCNKTKQESIIFLKKNSRS
ncbi:12726_t:CDS:2 [Rhizophagus irregularis]|nr:12726_t:CDS:2 [Rhizophagus irregularis]